MNHCLFHDQLTNAKYNYNFFLQWIFLLSYSLSYFFFFLFSSALLTQWTKGSAQFIIAAVSLLSLSE